jgi:hypothetical protein
VTKEQARKWFEPAVKKLRKHANSAKFPFKVITQDGHPSGEILLQVHYPKTGKRLQFLVSENRTLGEMSIYVLWLIIDLFAETTPLKCTFIYPKQSFNTNFATFQVGEKYISLSINRIPGSVARYPDIGKVPCTVFVSICHEPYAVWTKEHRIETNLVDAVDIIWNFLKLTEASNGGD